jgi:GTP-binding protein
MGLGQNPELVFTVLAGQPIPASTYPRWAVVGRSNVGKSSLLNALLHPKVFFRTGSRAGVTIGAICVRVQVHANKHAFLELVDLPGFGYAERSRTQTENWTQLIDEFRQSTNTRYLTWMWLVDPRREPDQFDEEVLRWIGNEKMVLVFTKSDKLRQKDRAHAEKSWRKFINSSTEKMLWTSSLDGEGFEDLQKTARATVREYCDSL